MSVPTSPPGEHPESGGPSARRLADVHRVALAKAGGHVDRVRRVEDEHLLALASAQAEVKGQPLAGALRDIAVGAIQECISRSEAPAEDASWLMSVATVHCRIRHSEQ